MPNVLHSHAKGIHPGAFVQAAAPDPVALSLQDGVLWVDTSTAPPWQLKCWQQSTNVWQLVGIVSAPSSGVDSGGNLSVACLTFPNGATICNDAAGVLHYNTPGSQFGMDATGVTLSGGHRLEHSSA